MLQHILLSVKEMRAAEKAAVDAGVSSASLMENAGARIAESVLRAWTKRPVVVLCGPGNNGGDGFVAARKLADAGWPVTTSLLGDRETLSGDAKLMAELYEGEMTDFAPDALSGAALVIDAIFGTGLSRPVDGAAKDMIAAVNAYGAPVVAVDIPSGVDADTGEIKGAAIAAARTVTFFAKKPGHVLFPGRALSGAVEVVDIGIEGAHAEGLRPSLFENHPALWARTFPRPGWRSHKFHRGHVYALTGGPLNTGAGRLAAMAAQRIGAGLTTVLSPSAAAAANAAHLTSIMLREADSADAVAAHLEADGDYAKVAIIGPATGVGEATRQKTLRILASAAGAVIDADALASFEDNPATLFKALRADDVLTPHGGEFARLFATVVDADADKLVAARAASAEAGAVIVYKGPDTVIAAPDGRAIINANAPPDLAVAGSGDVLAGLIAGLRAQGMRGDDAAAAGVWFHGAAAQTAGPGLTPEDLLLAIPNVLRALLTPPETPPAASPPEQ